MIPRLYALRFTEEARERKDRVWQVLCRSFFQRYVGANDTVLDLGAGYCEFINHIVCGRKIAVDLSDDVRRYAGPGVEVLQSASTDLSALGDNTINVAFVSNFFEHLPLKKDLLTTLSEIRRVLTQGGRLLILQPNIRYVGGAYWDFFDHHLPLTERSLSEALTLIGLTPVEVRRRFLPFTTKSALPQHPSLVWLYLHLPVVQWVLGRQSLIVAVKA